MIAILMIFVLFLLLCGEFTILFWIFAPFAGLYMCYMLYSTFRMSVDPEYRKKVERKVEKARREIEKEGRGKTGYKACRKYPTDRMFRNYYRTGDRNYLWNEDYRK